MFKHNTLEDKHSLAPTNHSSTTMPSPDTTSGNSNSKTTASPDATSGKHVSPAAMLSKLSIGALVQVSSPDGSLKYLTKLIGTDGSKTLITALPTPKQLKKESVSVVYDNLFFPEKAFVMRLIAQGVVFAFQSEVTAVNYSGCKLLLSTFPSKIQSQTLRQDARFPCALSCRYQFQEQQIEAVMVDISNGGCKIHFDPSKWTGDLNALKNQTLAIDIRFSSDEQASNITVKVMSLQKIENNEVALGLAFVQPEQQINDYLNSLQLNEMSFMFL